MSGVSTSSAKRGWLRSTRLPALGSPRHRRIHGSVVPLGCVPPLHQSLLWRLPHPIHLSCISYPLTLGELRTASEHRFPHFHPCHRRIPSVCPADGQAVTGHGQHSAWRAVPLGRDASPPISSTLIELRLQHGQSPVDIAGCDGVRIGHVAAPGLRRLMMTCGLLSRITQLEQRTALPDQCLHSADADVRPPRRKPGFDPSGDLCHSPFAP